MPDSSQLNRIDIPVYFSGPRLSVPRVAPRSPVSGVSWPATRATDCTFSSCKCSHCLSWNQMPVLLQIPENPNCEPVDGQVFACRTPSQVVTHIRRRRDDRDAWCSVIGMNPSGELCPAVACIVEDSGDGACYLVVGGAWGLRFKDSSAPWDLEDREQWGEPFLLLGGDGHDLRFHE
jgi:hypothetical protein